VAISGGQAPFNYNWTRLSGSRITVPSNTNATTATSASATFSATLVWSENLQESFQVSVTDSIGQLRTASVTVSFTSPPAPTVSISPNPLAISSPTNGGTASGSVTATGAGGVPPYNYNWAKTGDTLILADKLAADVFNAFAEAKRKYIERLKAGQIAKPTEVDQVHKRVMEITGDPLPYGIAPNRKVIQELIGHAVTQGIITRPVTVEQLFAPSTHHLVGLM